MVKGRSRIGLDSIYARASNSYLPFPMKRLRPPVLSLEPADDKVGRCLRLLAVRKMGHADELAALADVIVTVAQDQDP
ncbi:hypothetical protein L249_0847 [Ophiocordyceps polyrhachis-furcata BCC 54312]|uniref:Uncharacterized protein n=1 Tax=Ophiocordyceps polyrhachis-furcata BCC 54312 TaxID=1330021 RepID=A0A367LCA8_9HYPO|nr:hypothetical protein L249_0847 [Ophiocordyceps polyrhachis-furcata BCC 54312]